MRKQKKEGQEPLAIICLAYTIDDSSAHIKIKKSFYVERRGSCFGGITNQSLGAIIKELQNHWPKITFNALCFIPPVSKFFSCIDGYFGRPIIPVDVCYLRGLSKKQKKEIKNILSC